MYRRVASDPLWLEQKFTPGQAWVDLLLLANYRDGHIRVRGNKVRVKRGQVGYSLLSLSRRWKWSRPKVIRFLNELENERQIVQQKKRVSTVLTIVNYDKYQRRITTDRTTDNTTGGTTDVQQTEQQTCNRRDTNKKNKEFKELTTNDNGPEIEPLSEAWSSVVVLLESEGMDLAVSACEKARANGSIPAEVEALVKHWQDHKPAWDVGTLHNKICGLKQGRSVRWPKLSAEYERLQAVEKQKKANATAATTRKKQKNERAENEQRAAELEANFGAQLDAMSKAEIREVVREKFTVLLPMLNGTPCTGLIRKSMLGHLEFIANGKAETNDHPQAIPVV